MVKESGVVFTLSQVAKHKSITDCWVIINGRVLDVTQFLEDHPGGARVLLEAAGNDATNVFDDIGHSEAAKASLLKYQVGVLQGFKSDQDQEIAYKESYDKEMPAFVIKDDDVPNYKKFIEFFVPILVASFFFGYRYSTRATDFES